MSDKPVFERLRELGDDIRDAYVQNRRVMSFAEYLELVEEAPQHQLRSASQYVKDCFDHYGTTDVRYPWGPVRRFKLFDCPWDEGREALIGQEEVQNRLYRSLGNFVHEGTSNKLVLMHGPNGSAKSTLIRCIGRALQHYSMQPEGAVYRINWIFPAQKISRAGIGFSSNEYTDSAHGDTYAYLPDELIDAKLRDELRDHPLFLIPVDKRQALIDRLASEQGDMDGFVLSDYLCYGRLSHKNRAIFESLLTSYQGDYLKVLRHVQVERFFVQHRYREGYVTVEPQLSVDATERQITADRTISALPAALQSISLWDYGGELVDANRGLIEFSDLLKRPLEAYKYLLATVERGSVSLNTATLFLDLVFLGTSNEIHLSAFKEIPEWQSFRGRLELVRVPYLLDYGQEQQIYQQKIREAAGRRHVAPHCAYVAALWAVLTRMRKPQADRYPKEVAEVIARLSPLEKAELYAKGQVPDGLSGKQARDLLAHVEALWRESESYPNYEGRTGASPREILTVLFNAADSPQYDYVSPVAILDQIDELCKQVSVYDFLKQDSLPGGFHDNRKFIGLVRDRLIDCIDDEVRSALGLVEESEYSRLFERYVSNVVHWTRNEKIMNPATRRLEDPDENLMREVEGTLGVGSPADDFRHDLISKIGAWSLENPNVRPDYIGIFADHFRRLKESYFEKRRKQVRRGIDEVISLLTGSERSLSDEERTRARATVNVMVERFGYNEASARDAIGLLARSRYA